MKFWAQSFLIGTPSVLCGFRDNDGYVRKIQKLKTLDMPRMVRGQQGMWVSNSDTMYFQTSNIY